MGRLGNYTGPAEKADPALPPPGPVLNINAVLFKLGEKCRKILFRAQEDYHVLLMRLCRGFVFLFTLDEFENKIKPSLARRNERFSTWELILN